jgi:lipopolysaccharide/colanic/teichoic acid biosynthesis glycosyltransferase
MSHADLIGWLVTDKVLGVIRGLEGRAPTDSPAAHAAALQQDLLRCLTPDRAQHCSIRLEIYSPKSDTIPSVLLEGLVHRPTAKELVRDAAKRVLDIIGSLAFLVAFLPLFVAIALLVKCSSRGSVLFRQQRVGKAGQPFSMLKFRTMHVNADPAIHQAFVEKFIQAQEKPDGAQNVVFKIVGDPRVTRFGHFLRRSSLDELPQFWNVLKGEMSLVGPRPPVPYELARYKGWHRRRVLEAKPGVTGLWQVTGRSRTTFDEMVRLDLRYARSHSLWTDLKILLATPRAVISGKGAH